MKVKTTPLSPPTDISSVESLGNTLVNKRNQSEGKRNSDVLSTSRLNKKAYFQYLHQMPLKVII